MCQEVQNPGREVPRAIFLSVVVAGITGIIYLIPILFVLPDVSALLGIPDHQPIGLIFKVTTGSAAGGFSLLVLILGILFFAGVGALTAASRCTYAFARDGALPGSQFWSRINHRFEIPLLAVLLTAIVNCILGCIYFGSTMAFNAFCGVATICLSVSYGIPILISIMRRRELVKNSTYSLGKLGYVINSISVIWIIFAIFLFSLPTTIPTSTTTMNYASAVFAIFALVSFLYYIIQGRKSYTGPACEIEIIP